METATVYTHLLHVIGWLWVSPTLVRSMSNLYHMCIHTCIKPYLAASLASSVGHSYCAPYCHHVFHLLHWTSMWNSETMLEQGQQQMPSDGVGKDGRWNSERTALHHLCVAISFTLAPHTCSSLCCGSLRWRPGNWMWQKSPQVFASLLQWCNRYSHIVQLYQRTRFSYGAINPFQLYCKVHIPQGCVTMNTISPQHIVGYEGQLPP